MTDDQRYSERDVILRERAAFVTGVAYSAYRADSSDGSINEAKRRYPLKVERPRVVRDPDSDGDYEFRVATDEIQVRCKGGAWHGSQYYCPRLSLHRVALLADLLARPTELVDADE